MKPFTVVVLYPDRLQNNKLAPATYTAHVRAADAYKARGEGREAAWRAQAPKDRGNLAAWRALVVFEGHHEVKAWGWQA